MAVVVRSVLLDERERWLLGRVAHLVMLAYVPSSEPAATRGRDVIVVDDRDPRLRLLQALADQRNPVDYRRAQLAVEVLTEMERRAVEQSSRRFWLAPVKARHRPSGADRAWAEALAAERSGQVPRIREALTVARRVAALLVERDNPEFWARVEDGDRE